MSCVRPPPPPHPPSPTVQPVGTPSLNCPPSVIAALTCNPTSSPFSCTSRRFAVTGNTGTNIMVSSDQLAKGLAEGFPVPLQLGPLVVSVPALMRRVWPWRCPWAFFWPTACRLPGGRIWDDNWNLFSSDFGPVLSSRVFPQVSFCDSKSEKLFSPQFWVSFTSISIERGPGLRPFPNSVLVLASVGGRALCGGEAGTSPSVPPAGEHLSGSAVFSASVRCQLRGPSLFRSPPSALPPSGSHAWNEGMIGTDRARREGGGKVVSLSRRVQGTSVQPFLPGKWQSEVLLRSAPTFPLAESHLQAERRRKKWQNWLNVTFQISVSLEMLVAHSAEIISNQNFCQYFYIPNLV